MFRLALVVICSLSQIDVDAGKLDLSTWDPQISQHEGDSPTSMHPGRWTREVHTKASFKVSIDPPHVRIGKNIQNVTFTCNVNRPLAGCQFHFHTSDDKGKTTPLDCSEGQRVKFDANVVPIGVQNYYYTGTGLENGQCGVMLKVNTFKQWVVGCRVREANGSWTYDFADIYARDDYLTITVEPEKPVVLPKQDLNVMCSVPDNELSACSFFIKGLHQDSIDFSSGLTSPDSTYPHIYQGEGLDNGQCGIILRNVSILNNGPATCLLTDNDNAQGVGFVNVVVAIPPDQPNLIVDQDSLGERRIEASCSVSGGRPVPTITWKLGDRVIREDNTDDTVSSDKDEWIWPWNVTSISQKLVHELKSGEEGETLKCIVTHMALNKPLEVSASLSSNKLTTVSPTEKTEVVTTKVRSTRNANSCHRLSSPTVDISCVYQSKPVVCNLKAKFNTEALVTCKEGYSSSDDETNRTIICQENGLWSNKLLNCDKGCGEISRTTPLIVGGKDSFIPWQIGIYYKEGHVCGGTLIHNKYVLSAAHCFWNEGTKKVVNESYFTVTAGKTERKYHAKEPNSQKLKVLRIDVHPRYRGIDTSFRYDIALIKLKTRVRLEAGVRLACLDSTGMLEEELLTPESKGTVAGWGVRDGGLPSRFLQAVELPYINYTKCVDTIPSEVRQWLTYDKFCAGYIDKSMSVCQGDSGGGLVFQHPESKRFYLLGVVSSNFAHDHIGTKCYDQRYTAFTHVSLFYKWFAGIMEVD